MKTILTSFLLAVIGLLAGCATLMQPRDPNVVSAEATASSAEKWVSTFLSFASANPQLGLAEKSAAENLTRSFDPDLKNLYGTLALYKNNPMANQGPLADAIQRVLAHESIAKRFMNGGEIRGQGAPFAPPIGIGPPQGPATVLDSVLERLDGIRSEQASQRLELTAIKAAVGKIAVMTIPRTNAPVPGIIYSNTIYLTNLNVVLTTNITSYFATNITANTNAPAK